MTVKDTLIAAKALIDTPEKHTQFYYARDKRGIPVETDDPRACKFCSVGAIQRVTANYLEVLKVKHFLDNAVKQIGVDNVVYANDYCSHAKVMEMWDFAIKLAGEQEDTQNQSKAAFKTKAEEILNNVAFNDYAFKVVQEGENFYMQAQFPAQCNETGKWEAQSTRKWRLSEHMSKSEIVQTALKLVLTAVEHEAREQFKYRKTAIFAPHYNVEALVHMAGADNAEDRRQESPTPQKD